MNINIVIIKGFNTGSFLQGFTLHDTGFYTRFGEIGDTAYKICLALGEDSIAANRQEEMFSMKHRRDGLSKILEGVME